MNSVSFNDLTNYEVITTIKKGLVDPIKRQNPPHIYMLAKQIESTIIIKLIN